MPNSITLKYQTNNWKKRARGYIANIQAKAEESAPVVLETILADVEMRTPTPEREEELIMYGEAGAPPITNVRVNRTNNQRIRFQREPGMWLKDAIRDPGTYSIKGTRILVGNIAALNEITKFSWTDASTRIGVNQHTTNYGMFSIFEFGSNILGFGHVKPSFGDYFLTPSEYSRVKTYNKTIPPFGMFSGLNGFMAMEAMKDQLREVQF